MKTVFIFFSVCILNVSFKAQFFTKLTGDPIVNTPGDSRSVNWIDVNGDGFMDCMITNGPFGGQDNTLYLNNGSGGFTSVISDVIVSDHKPSDGATWADIDNDGDVDCFVANWYNVNNLFYLNNGTANFTQVTSGSLVADLGYSETASWGDYDNDGYVDLYVTNSAGNMKNFLYRNTGTGSFTKILTGNPVTDADASRCVNWSDIDNDNDLDLFVTNEGSQNECLYRNDGGGNFTKLTTGALLNNGGNTMSGSWGDYDNDGDMDVFLANDGNNNALFRNDGGFNFTKIITDTVSKSNGHSFSSSWSDVDNDGDLDLFVTNCFSGSLKRLNFFYLNNNNGTFTRNGTDVVATDSSWSYGCAFGDYDNDGFEDLAVATTRFSGTDLADLIYHNNGNSNNWITIKLEGTLANKAAIGTKIKVKAIIGGNPVWQTREISAQSSYCGQNDLRAHFGLGNASVIDSIKIEWMPGGLDVFKNVSVNQFINVTQNLGITQMEENIMKQDISIYPNPSHGKISIKLAKDKFTTGDRIVILDAGSKIIKEHFVGTGTQFVEISLKEEGMKLSSGTYFLRFTRNSTSVTKKVIIH